MLQIPWHLLRIIVNALLTAFASVGTGTASTNTVILLIKLLVLTHLLWIIVKCVSLTVYCLLFLLVLQVLWLLYYLLRWVCTVDSADIARTDNAATAVGISTASSDGFATACTACTARTSAGNCHCFLHLFLVLPNLCKLQRWKILGSVKLVSLEIVAEIVKVLIPVKFSSACCDTVA